MAASAGQRSQIRSSGKPATLTAVRPNGPLKVVARRTAAQQGETIEQCVRRSLEQYFDDLGGAKPHALHEMVMSAVERPLLQFALERCAGNQSAAADLLGINRNTLRKRLLAHGLAT